MAIIALIYILPHHGSSCISVLHYKYLTTIASVCSVREMCGKEDIDTTYKHFKAFFEMFSDIDQKLNVDF